MKKLDLIDFSDEHLDKCDIYAKSKLVKKPFSSVSRDSNLLDLIHFDICELNRMLTHGGKRYFSTFVDDCNRILYVYLLKLKDEVFAMFKKYIAEVENQLEKKIKVLRSDRRGEKKKKKRVG